METALFLHEKLYWLNIDANDNKKIHTKYEAKYLYALAALVLMELLVRQNIFWKNKDNLQGIAENPPKDSLLLEIWEWCVIPNKINWFWFAGKKQATAQTLKNWLDAIVRKTPNFVKKIEQKLVEKQFITVTESKILGVIPTQKIELKNATSQENYKKILADSVYLTSETDVNHFILLKIIKACKIHKMISPQKDSKNMAIFYEQLSSWTTQKIDNEEIIRFLEGLEVEKDLEDMLEALDYLTDAIDGIADAIGDAGGDSGGGGDGGGD